MTGMSLRYVALAGLLAVALAGCKAPQAPEAPEELVQDMDVDALAVGVDLEQMVEPPDYVATILDAAGGLEMWTQHKKLRAGGVVRLYQDDESFSVTEHLLEVYPWSNAIRVLARDPESALAWQVIEGQYEILQGDPSLDTSSLAGSHGQYADAVLKIVTVPVRLLDTDVVINRNDRPVQRSGVWYQLIEARYGAKLAGLSSDAVATGLWTECTYYFNRATRIVDLIWLADAVSQKYFVVRGYDYNTIGKDGIQLPSRIELFRSDAEGAIYERFARIDVSGQ